MNLGKLLYHGRETGHATTNPLVRKLVMLRCKYTCQICSRKYTMRKGQNLKKYFYEAHIDHIIPFSFGGRNHIDNYQLLCKECNLRKSNRVEEL